jgi:hypothetical protein
LRLTSLRYETAEQRVMELAASDPSTHARRKSQVF